MSGATGANAGLRQSRDQTRMRRLTARALWGCNSEHCHHQPQPYFAVQVRRRARSGTSGSGTSLTSPDGLEAAQGFRIVTAHPGRGRPRGPVPSSHSDGCSGTGRQASSVIDGAYVSGVRGGEAARRRQGAPARIARQARLQPRILQRSRRDRRRSTTRCRLASSCPQRERIHFVQQRRQPSARSRDRRTTSASSGFRLCRLPSGAAARAGRGYGGTPPRRVVRVVFGRERCWPRARCAVHRSAWSPAGGGLRDGSHVHSDVAEASRRQSGLPALTP
jgi:hypothetical protein